MPDAKPPDLLALHADGEPREARGDRRPRRRPHHALELRRAERALRTGSRTACWRSASSRGDRVIWCGMNSPEVVAMTHAARKLGATAVPLNYRLAPDEAGLRRRQLATPSSRGSTPTTPSSSRGSATAIPKVREVAIYGGTPAPGQLAAEELARAGRRRASPSRPPAVEASTMIYTSGTTGHPKGARAHAAPATRSRRRALIALIGYQPDDVYLTHRPALPLGARRLHGRRLRARQHASCSSASSTPRTGCACSRPTA